MVLCDKHGDVQILYPLHIDFFEKRIRIFCHYNSRLLSPILNRMMLVEASSAFPGNCIPLGKVVSNIIRKWNVQA